jgi:hypothetical protein
MFFSSNYYFWEMLHLMKRYYAIFTSYGYVTLLPSSPSIHWILEFKGVAVLNPLLSQLTKQWIWAMLVVSVCHQNQNALHRLLAVMLDEHCCSIGPVGPHNLLLFGSDILTWEIATASASTKPHSSCSSDLQLKLSDGCWLKSSSEEPAPTWFPGDTSAFAGWQEVAAPWFFVFDLMDNVFKVRSV